MQVIVRTDILENIRLWIWVKMTKNYCEFVTPKSQPNEKLEKRKTR